MGINRLRNSRLFSIDTLAVISEESMRPLCKKYNIDYVFYKNEPLGEKKNYGLTQAMKKDWDYLIELGSDDLLRTDILELYRPHFGKFDLFGLKYVMYLNSETGECREIQTNTAYGCGRAISRRVIDKCRGVDVLAKVDMIGGVYPVSKGKTGFYPEDHGHEFEKLGYGTIVSEVKYKLWKDEIMKGMDNSSNYFLARKGVLFKGIPSDKAMAIDIKSKENIWPFNPELGDTISFEEAMKGLSQEEQSALITIIKKNKRECIETAVIR